MSFEDPRRSLPPLNVLFKPPGPKLTQSRRSFPHLPRSTNKQVRPKKVPCYDWIFSAATNIHIIIDKSWFKTFTPFDSYVLTVAGQRPISMRGIGSVELKIRCKPNSHQSRVILLENVLYVPNWLCNIFSDTYFDSNTTFNSVFEHRWTATGVCFTKNANGKIKHWGYTDGFCGLDRLVLSRKPQGRSPLLDDKDREVWSVNVHWPKGQQDKWEDFKARELQRLAKEHEAEILAQQEEKQKNTCTGAKELLVSKNVNTGTPNPKLKSRSPVSPSKVSIRSISHQSLAKVMARQVSVASFELENVGARLSLNEISSNKGITVKNNSESRVSSLKASFTANRGLLKDFLAVQSKENQDRIQT